MFAVMCNKISSKVIRFEDPATSIKTAWWPIFRLIWSVLNTTTYTSPIRFGSWGCHTLFEFVVVNFPPTFPHICLPKPNYVDKNHISNCIYEQRTVDLTWIDINEQEQRQCYIFSADLFLIAVVRLIDNTHVH